MPDILVSRDGAITTITLNRPAAMNAFDVPMAADLAETVRAAADDSSCRVMVLTGAGRGFCAGADLKHLREIIGDGDVTRGRELVAAGTRIVEAIVAAPKPVIAAVNGPAAGGGASLALACDIRMAAHGASIGVVFNQVGLHPDLGATYLLPRLVGLGRAMELVLSGEMIPASEATRIGLFNRLVDGDDLLIETYALARRLAAKSPVAVARAKRSMHVAASASLGEALAREMEQQLALIEMQETRDALRSFLERR